MTRAFQKFLADHPVFTSEDYQRAEPTASHRAIRDRIGRAVKRGDILRVQNDLFASVPPACEAHQFMPDQFHVMAALRPDAVLCGHSALEQLGLAYSIWNECWAYTSGRREVFTFQGMRYRPAAPPPILVKQGLHSLGLVRHDRAGVIITSLGPERVLVEGFRNLNQYGGLGEFLQSVDALQRINERLLLRLLEAYDEGRLYSAIGWFLESDWPVLEASEELIRSLIEKRSKGPVYLDRSMGEVIKNRRWNLLIPERLLHWRDVSNCEY
jgi:hypothetical protein